jgi:hypothetical protein
MHYIAPGQYRERYEGYYYNLWYVWHNAGGRVVRGWRYQIEGSIESSLFETRTMAAKAARCEIRRSSLFALAA